MANRLLKNIKEKTVWRYFFYDSPFCLSPFRPGNYVGSKKYSCNLKKSNKVARPNKAIFFNYII